jgi:threonine dehydrogenase-like Zn-dependent dehydrogenase
MRACGICKFDIKCYKGALKNPDYCSAPGHEGVGVVEAVGPGVRDLSAGHKVSSFYLGGAMAERYLADHHTVARIPDEVEDYPLWVAEPVACVVSAIRLLGIVPGDRVVVLGCGYMGQLLIQGLPRELIPILVAVDTRNERLALAVKHGADQTVNASGEDPVRVVSHLLGREADVVIETVGLPGVLGQATDMLRPGGTLCIFGHHAEDELLPTDTWHMKGIRVLNTTPFSSRDFHRDLQDAVALTAKGVYDQHDLVQRVYPLAEVDRAMRETAHNAGVLKAVLVSG